MAREFVVSIGQSTVANQAVTLISLIPASAPNPNIEFMRHWVGQSANATSAQQHVQIVTQLSSWPSLAGFTPKKLKPAEPNASVIVTWASNTQGTVGINATGESAGTKTIVWDDSFNVLNGWLLVPNPAETLILPANIAGTAAAYGLHFPSAPSTLTGWSWGCTYREV